MNAQTPTTLPPLAEERALTIAAFAALIDQTLDGEALLPRFPADNLVARLNHTGLAQVKSTADGLRMTLHGITASSDGSTHGLLRAWQHAARDRLAMGVQK